MTTRRHLSLPFSGDRCRELRERAGLSITALTDRINEAGYRSPAGRPLHSTTIGKVERGEHGPMPGLLRAIADALEVDIDDLLDPKVGAA